MNFKLEIYGWSVEAMAFSLDNSQVKSILDLMDKNNYSELWEVRNELEDLGIIDDIYDPDILHESKGLVNDALWFIVKDEENKEVLTFGVEEMSDFVQVLGDDDVPYEGYSLTHRVLVIVLILRISLQFLMKEKEELLLLKHLNLTHYQKPIDFCYQKGDIKTPDGDWKFVSKLFFNGEELEVDEYLDYTSKSSTIQIFRKDNTVIS